MSEEIGPIPNGLAVVIWTTDESGRKMKELIGVFTDIDEYEKISKEFFNKKMKLIGSIIELNKLSMIHYDLDQQSEVEHVAYTKETFEKMYPDIKGL